MIEYRRVDEFISYSLLEKLLFLISLSTFIPYPYSLQATQSPFYTDTSLVQEQNRSVKNIGNICRIYHECYRDISFSYWTQIVLFL